MENPFYGVPSSSSPFSRVFSLMIDTKTQLIKKQHPSRHRPRDVRVHVRRERRPNLFFTLLPQRHDDDAPLLINLERTLGRSNGSKELALKGQVADAHAHASRTKPDGHVRTDELVYKLAERQVELDNFVAVVPGKSSDFLGY